MSDDTDYFSFTVSQPSLLDATLTPRGGVFTQASQGQIPTSFNANARNNLALAVFDTNGTSILATANANPAGVVESLADVMLPGAGTYYARIDGADDTIQLYELSLSVAALLPGDFNFDGVVDASRLCRVAKRLGNHSHAGRLQRVAGKLRRAGRQRLGARAALPRERRSGAVLGDVGGHGTAGCVILSPVIFRVFPRKILSAIQRGGSVCWKAGFWRAIATLREDLMKGLTWGLCAAVLLSIGLTVSPAAAVNPAVSGSLTVPFIFVPDDPEQPGNQSYWYWSQGISGGISLSVPSVMEITTSVLGSGLDWSNNNIWNTFPLDSGGLSITASGSGTYNVSVNGGSPTLNVLGGGGGPTEGTVQTRVDFSNIHGSGSVDGFGSATILSNIVPTKYNVTIPAGAHVTGTGSNVQNLTINHNASLLMPTIGGDGPSFGFVRQNLTNHGTAELNGEVQGNFINDALPANGDVATTPHLVLNGQLQNTGELRVTQYFKTVAATSNAGTIKLNGGTFLPQAAFANNGTFEFSAGALDGPGVVTNNGNFDWSGGAIYNSVVNATNAFTISGPNGRHLGGSLTNSGTITHSGGNILNFAGAAQLTNQAGALYDITDDSTMYDGFGGQGTIDNAGTFRKSGGSGETWVSSVFNNTGTIAVTSGTIRFLGGGTFNGGTMNFANGGIVDLNHGDFYVQGSPSVSGDGALVISGGGAKGIVANGNSVSFANFAGGADLILSGGGELRTDVGGTLNLNLSGTSEVTLGGPSGSSGGRIGGAGTTINSGNFKWAQGTVAGNLRNDSVNFTISSTESHTIEGGILTNTSTIAHSDDATVHINSGGTLVNQAGSLRHHRRRGHHGRRHYRHGDERWYVPQVGRQRDVGDHRSAHEYGNAGDRERHIVVCRAGRARAG